MAHEFKDIKIIGMDDDVRPARDDAPAIVTVTLNLSDQPPAHWAEMFDDEWQRNIYMMKRRARVRGKSIEIDCALSELKDDHLPELKKVVSQVNEEYARHAKAVTRKEAEEQSRKDALTQEVKSVKGQIKFD